MRLAESVGGFGAVLRRGERDAGTILLLTMQKGADACLMERMPQLDGTRKWELNRQEDPENKQELADYLARRAAQDDDLWVVELDVPDRERFVAQLPR